MILIAVVMTSTTLLQQMMSISYKQLIMVYSIAHDTITITIAIIHHTTPLYSLIPIPCIAPTPTPTCSRRVYLRINLIIINEYEDF